MASLIEEELRERLDRQGREHTQDLDRLSLALVRQGRLLIEIGQVEGKDRSAANLAALLHNWEDNFRREVRTELEVARYTSARKDECQTALYLAGEARQRQPEVSIAGVKKALDDLVEQVERL